jgi:hypothetical protein
MNERYEQLMAQAWIEFAPDAQAVTKRFAELIVKECVDICEDTEGEHIPESRWGRRCCALEIRQHFGLPDA